MSVHEYDGAALAAALDAEIGQAWRLMQAARWLEGARETRYGQRLMREVADSANCQLHTLLRIRRAGLGRL